VAKVHRTQRSMTQPGIGPLPPLPLVVESLRVPTMTTEPAPDSGSTSEVMHDVAQAWEAIVAESAPPQLGDEALPLELVDEEWAKSIRKPVAAAAVATSEALDVDEAEAISDAPEASGDELEANPVEPEAVRYANTVERAAMTDEPQPVAHMIVVNGVSIELPQVCARPHKPIAPRRKPRARIWPAFVLAGACAGSIGVIALTSSDAQESRRAAPAAMTVADQQRAAIGPTQMLAPEPPPAQVQAIPAQVQATPEPEQMQPAPAKPEPVQPAPLKPTSRPNRVAETPVLRAAAAKASPSPKRSKLSVAAVPAVAAFSPEDEQAREALLVQYQRVGHNLLLAKRDLGPEAVAPVTQRFRWLKLEPALATKTSRQLMARTLRYMQAQLDGIRRTSSPRRSPAP